MSANSDSAVTIELKAFVEATAISGPEWMYTPCPQARAIVLPTTFTTPMTRPPLVWISRTAPSVSAVSPDWLTAR